MTPLPNAHSAVDAAVRQLGAWSGLAFRDADRAGIGAAMRRAMAAAGLTDPADLPRLLRHDAPARDALIAELTVGETYFFREPGQLNFLRHTAIPAILQRHPGSPLRVWSAGCASGEEAYSLAILIREMGLAEHAWIVGTDIVRARLTQARRGRYGRWSLRGMGADTMQRYFRRRGAQFELATEIRAAVEFRQLNLAEVGYPSTGAGIWGMDLILCRNVLIYLDAETVARVARGLLDSLNDDGWLVLGGADPPLAGLVECDTIATGEGIAYRRRAARSEPARAQPAPNPEVMPSPPAAEPTERPRAPMAADLQSMLRLVRSRADAGRLDDAGRACDAGLDRFPACAELVYLQSMLLAAAGRHRDAAAAASRALYLDRTLIVAHLGLGCALVRLGDAKGAARAFRNAEHLLAALAPSAEVPASGGEPAAPLANIARAQLRLLGETA
jgi:chemotaxis protein methyltransferase CheR